MGPSECQVTMDNKQARNLGIGIGPTKESKLTDVAWSYVDSQLFWHQKSP